MVSYRIMYDATQDAYNWYSAVTKIGQLKKVQDTLDFEMAEKIQDLNFDQAKKILIPYLENHKKSSVANFERIMKEQLAKYFAAAVQRLEKTTGHPLAIQNCAKNRAKEITKIAPHTKAPNEDVLFLITSFPAMVVYYEEGTVYTYAKIDDELWGMPLDGILHELIHFQTDYYYRQNSASSVAKLNDDEYYVLKESLPALLDESWKPIITLPDCSYPEFKPLRKVLLDQFASDPNFDRLMEFGAKEVRKMLGNKIIKL